MSKNLFKVAARIENKLKKIAIHQVQHGKCQYPEEWGGCEKPATVLLFTRGTWDEDDGKFRSVCEEHSHRSDYDSGVEYDLECPNCKCHF